MESMPGLAGRRALVIGGAGPGNGGASSRALAAGGAAVAVADRDESRAKTLAGDLTKRFPLQVPNAPTYVAG